MRTSEELRATLDQIRAHHDDMSRCAMNECGDYGIYRQLRFDAELAAAVLSYALGDTQQPPLLQGLRQWRDVVHNIADYPHSVIDGMMERKPTQLPQRGE